MQELEQLREKIREQAKRLKADQEYVQLCETRICQLQPGHEIPITKEHLKMPPLYKQELEQALDKIRQLEDRQYSSQVHLTDQLIFPHPQQSLNLSQIQFVELYEQMYKKYSECLSQKGLLENQLKQEQQYNDEHQQYIQELQQYIEEIEQNPQDNTEELQAEIGELRHELKDAVKAIQVAEDTIQIKEKEKNLLIDHIMQLQQEASNPNEYKKLLERAENEYKELLQQNQDLIYQIREIQEARGVSYDISPSDTLSQSSFINNSLKNSLFRFGYLSVPYSRLVKILGTCLIPKISNFSSEKRYQAYIDQLKDSIRHYKLKCRRLKEQGNSHYLITRQLQDELMQEKSHYSELQQTLYNLEDQLENSNNVIDELNAQIEQKEADIAEQLDIQAQNSQTALQEQKSKIEELKAQISQIKSESGKTTNQLQNKIEHFQEQLSRSLTQNAALKDDNEDLNNRIDTLTDSLNKAMEYSSERDALIAESQHKQQLLQIEKEKLLQAKQTIITLTSRNQDLAQLQPILHTCLQAVTAFAYEARRDVSPRMQEILSE